MEVHENPARALSDGPNAYRLAPAAGAAAAAAHGSEGRARLTPSGVRGSIVLDVHATPRARCSRSRPQAILRPVRALDASFDRAVARLLLACTGRVVVTGMGKSGIIGQKISATLASTGTPSLFLHPAEAIHGDLGRIVKGDVVLAVSYSGDTGGAPRARARLKRLGVPLVALTGNAALTARAGAADVHLDVGVREEACPLGLAPTASTTAALAMGDALCMALLERRGFTVEDFAVLHPGGRLGKKLPRVEDLMHTGDEIPRVSKRPPR